MRGTAIELGLKINEIQQAFNCPKAIIKKSLKSVKYVPKYR